MGAIERSFRRCCFYLTELGGLLRAGACLPSNKRPRQSDVNQAPQLNDVFPVWLEASQQERCALPSLPNWDLAGNPKLTAELHQVWWGYLPVI